ncbi:hypothetical protein Tco_0209392 [Tanacetum coccineum]
MKQWSFRKDEHSTSTSTRVRFCLSTTPFGVVETEVRLVHEKYQHLSNHPVEWSLCHKQLRSISVLTNRTVALKGSLSLHNKHLNALEGVSILSSIKKSYPYHNWVIIHYHQNIQSIGLILSIYNVSRGPYVVYEETSVNGVIPPLSVCDTFMLLPTDKIRPKCLCHNSAWVNSLSRLFRSQYCSKVPEIHMTQRRSITIDFVEVAKFPNGVLLPPQLFELIAAKTMIRGAALRHSFASSISGFTSLLDIGTHTVSVAVIRITYWVLSWSFDAGLGEQSTWVVLEVERSTTLFDQSHGLAACSSYRRCADLRFLPYKGHQAESSRCQEDTDETVTYCPQSQSQQRVLNVLSFCLPLVDDKLAMKVDRSNWVPHQRGNASASASNTTPFSLASISKALSL